MTASKGPRGRHPIPERSGKLEGAKPQPCCGKILNGYTLLPGDAERPKPGDYSICVYCGTVLGFALDAAGELTVVRLDDTEHMLALAHPDIKRALAAWRRHFRG